VGSNENVCPSSRVRVVWSRKENVALDLGMVRVLFMVLVLVLVLVLAMSLLIREASLLLSLLLLYLVSCCVNFGYERPPPSWWHPKAPCHQLLALFAARLCVWYSRKRKHIFHASAQSDARRTATGATRETTPTGSGSHISPRLSPLVCVIATERNKY